MSTTCIEHTKWECRDIDQLEGQPQGLCKAVGADGSQLTRSRISRSFHLEGVGSGS